MAVKLHRCSFLWFKSQAHPCWRVQSALDQMGIEYEVVKGPSLPYGRRKEVLRLSGQKYYPVVEFEDGRAYREQSKDMRARILAGRLFEGRGGWAPGEEAAAPVAEEAPPAEEAPAAEEHAEEHGHEHSHEHGEEHRH